MRHLIVAVSAALVLSACAGHAKRSKPVSASERAKLPMIDKDPFPSTYRPYGSAPTLIRGANIYDGAGGKIVGGEVLMVDGKIAEIGQTVAAPEGVTVIDAAGKWRDAGHHRRPLPPRRLSLAGGRRALGRQRSDRPDTARGLGRALRLAAGPGLQPRARRRHHHAAHPARLGEPVRRPRRDAAQRARRADGAGHEVPGRAVQR